MIKLKKLKNKRVLLTLYLSFVATFLFPVLLMSIITNYGLLEAVEKDQKESNLNALSQSREILDYNFKYINSMAYQLSLSPTILSFASQTPIDASEKAIQIKNIVNEMSIYNVSKDIFYLTAIYIKNRDMIITPVTAYTSREFYDKISKYEGMTYEEWFDHLNNVSYQTFWQSQKINPGTSSEKEITTITTPLPLGYGNAPLSFICYIDTNMVFNIFGKSFSNKEGEIIITDNNNNQLIYSTNQPFDNIAIPVSHNQDNGIFDVTLDGVNYVGVYDSSHVVTLKYLYLIPQTVFFGISNHIRNIFIITVVSCLILGAVIVFIISQKNYKPLNAILQSISKNNPDIQGQNEYDIIQNSFKQISTKYEMLESKVDFQMMQLVHNYLNRLLRMSDINEEECLRYLTTYNLNLIQECLCVIVVTIDSFSDFSPEQSLSDKRSATFAIMNIAKDVLASNCPVYTFETDSDNVAIITASSAEDKELYEKLLYIKNVLGNRLGIYVSIGVGETCGCPSKLHISHKTAIRALDHGRITAVNSITLFSDIEIPSELIFYPVDREMQLINSIKGGNKKQVLHVLDEIYKANFVENTISQTMTECLFHNIAATLVKTLSDINMGKTDIYQACTELIQHVSSESTDSFFKSCKSIAVSICERIASDRQQSNDSLIGDVCVFMEKNYSLQTLSLEYAADYFHVTYTYLSKIFKDNTGYNFIDYLNRLRLERSKEILSSTQESIQEVSAMVGYSSSNTYIRIFKKYHGITPGQYRAMALKEANQK